MYTKKDKSIYSIFYIAIPIVFLDARVFFRSIFYSNQVGDLIGAGYFLFFLFYIVYLYHKYNIHFKNITLYILCIYLYSLIRYWFEGISYGVLIQWSLVYIAIIILSFILNIRITAKHFINAFLISTLLNLIAIYEPTGYIQGRVAVNTALGSSIEFSDYSYGIIRQSGFLGAPGALSASSAIGFLFSLILFLDKKKIIYLFFVFVNLINGLSTYNRSFIIAIVLGLFIVFFFLYPVRKFIFNILWISPFILIFYFSLSTYTEYIDKVSTRFSSETLERDIDTRTKELSGIDLAIRAVENNPVFGSASKSKIGDSLVIDADGIEMLPHNGLYQIFASRGIPFGLFFLFLIIFSYTRLYKKSKIAHDTYTKCFFMSMTTILVISLVESFWEHPLMLCSIVCGFTLSRNN
ncbi:MAG: hypothetical protein Fur0028_11870 [Bacteroidales bacterium]